MYSVLLSRSASAGNLLFALCYSNIVVVLISIKMPRHEKTNNVISVQDRHKPNCLSIKDGYRLEILDLERK